jgi:D-sedoheptulose 7-phosphate isomerase
VTTNRNAAEASVRQHFESSAAALRRAADQCAPDIAAAARLIEAALKSGGKLLLCGNGGSAADCQHVAAEFVNLLDRARPRPALAAIALTTDTSLLLGGANDRGFEQVFARQVEALGRAGDVLLAISTSGDSPNVLRALERARALRLATVLLSGEAGGAARRMADVAILIPSGTTQHIQEAHITVGHILCDLVERALFPGGG